MFTAEKKKGKFIFNKFKFGRVTTSTFKYCITIKKGEKVVNLKGTYNDEMLLNWITRVVTIHVGYNVSFKKCLCYEKLLEIVLTI